MDEHTKKRVIIFEDNSHLRDSLYFLVNTSPDFECVAAYPDTRQALTNVRKINPDVIIMDIEMPVMNGIETTLYIKNKMNLGDKEPKIVALTAHDPILFKADYENVPFDNVVTKPYSAEKIKDIITSFFGS